MFQTRPFPSVHVSLISESQDDHNIITDGQKYCFTIPEVHDGGQLLWDDSTLDKILDIAHPTSTPSPPQSTSASFDLSVYEVRLDSDNASSVLTK